MSNVSYQISDVKCHISNVIYQISFFKIDIENEAQYN